MAVLLNDIAQLSLRGVIAGQRIIMVRTYRCSAPSAGTTTYTEDMQALIAKVSADSLGGIRGRYLSLLPTAFSLSEIRAQVIYPTRRVLVSVTQTGQNGSNEGSGNVTNLAGVITFRTALSGRKQISNVHVGPIPPDAISAGSLDAAYRLPMTELKDLLTAVLTPTGFDVASWTPCVYHRAAVAPAPRYDDILTGVVQTTARVMRRRTVGVGE